MEEHILDEELDQAGIRRRELLPIWLKVFSWIFFIGGLFLFYLIVDVLLAGRNVLSLSLYGLSTIRPYSMLGLFIIGLYTLKTIVAIGLWTEKDWAVDLALLDAGLGIFISLVVMMIILPLIGSRDFSLRFDLLFVIPYFLELRIIAKKWRTARAEWSL